MVEPGAFVLDFELLIEDVEACWRVEAGRVLHLQHRLIKGLGPLEGGRDDWDLLRNRLKLAQEVVLAITNLFYGIASRTLRLCHAQNFVSFALNTVLT